ncbi:hypothetical protein AKO1_004476, partial [Acrasis kona]
MERDSSALLQKEVNVIQSNLDEMKLESNLQMQQIKMERDQLLKSQNALSDLEMSYSKLMNSNQELQSKLDLDNVTNQKLINNLESELSNYKKSNLDLESNYSKLMN